MILWAHGLEGSPEGTKVQALRAAGFEVEAPDGRGMVLAHRLAGLEAASARLADRRPVLAGSSYGGLAAAWLAQAHPERFRAVLLLAPALFHREAPALEPVQAPGGLRVHVIHGAHDDVVPLQGSRDYVDGAGPAVTLEVVDDDHPLVGSLDRIIAACRELSALGR